MARKKYSKQSKAIPSATTATATSTNTNAEAFSFGDPEPMLQGRMWDFFECGFNGKWYEPPVPFEGLAKSFRANPHHETALRFKRDVLEMAFIPHSLLSSTTFSALILDYLVFGNGYLERVGSLTRKTLGLRHTLAKFTRRCSDLDRYVFLQGGNGVYGRLWAPQETHEFEKGSIFHMREADINQEVYGMPFYLGALQSVWLNEEATLFRRKYYLNGSHAGFILYLNDPVAEQADIDALRDALKNSKGPGNFKNLFMYAPGGKKDGLQLIPVGDVSAKDEFMNIKNISRDDILVAHRTPPQLMGLVPQNAGGFGSIKDAAQVYISLNILPLFKRFEELNNWMGEKVVKFVSVDELMNIVLGQTGSR